MTGGMSRLAPVAPRSPQGGMSPVGAAGAPPQELRTVDSRSGVSTAGGDLVLDFGQPPVGFSWLVERIIVDGASAGNVRFYHGIQNPGNLGEYSGIVGTSVADEASPFYVPAGQNLFAVLAAVGASVPVTVNVQLRVVA